MQYPEDKKKNSTRPVFLEREVFFRVNECTVNDSTSSFSWARGGREPREEEEEEDRSETRALAHFIL